MNMYDYNKAIFNNKPALTTEEITEGKNVRVTLYDTTHTCVECRGVRGKSNTRTEYFID